MITQQTEVKSDVKITQLQQNIINNFQKGFPLCSNPYAEMANKLNNRDSILTNENQVTELAVFNALKGLDILGVTSRIGPVFDHKKAGASTLAALAVKEEELDRIASIVNQFEQVNHNYARSTHFNKTNYNLWFVVTASDPVALNAALTRIEQLTGLKVLVLPMEASYHLDLAFSINVTGQDSLKINNAYACDIDDKFYQPLSEVKKSQLRKLIESGLPLKAKPYQNLAEIINASEEQVLAQIATWQQTGLIRRFGLVIKHRKLGYNANAMVVWNIQSKHVDAIAEQLAKRPEVSLCYRRPKRLPDWPYNLFCMIHGTDKDFVLNQIKTLTDQLSLVEVEKDILFSYKAYKQKGARYSKEKAIKNEVAHG